MKKDTLVVENNGGKNLRKTAYTIETKEKANSFSFAKLSSLLNRSAVKKTVGVVITASISISYFGVAQAGSVNDVTLQIPQEATVLSGYTTSVTDVTTAPSQNLLEVDYEQLASDSINQSTDDKVITVNTYIVSEQTNVSGIPEEILTSDAFTHDGSDMWVSCTEANVRVEPTVDSDVVTTIKYSACVTRLSYGVVWSFVRLDDGTEGYVLSDFLSDDEIIAPTPTPTPVPTATPTPTRAPTSAPTNTSTNVQTSGDVTETPYSATVYATCALNVRSGPDVSYSLVKVLSSGDSFPVVAKTSNGWYKTEAGNYVKIELCSETQTGSSSSSSSSGTTATPVSPSNSDLATYARSFVGVPYVYAGSSPSGFDCSGFVSYIYANYYGITLPHNAASIATYGTSVSASDIMPGDVLCHDYNGDGAIDHVSLYIGDGTCVHASNSRSGVITSAFPMGCVVTIRRIT